MKLKPHQVKADKWRKKKYKEGIRKILLALDMGLGKTVISAVAIKKSERVLVICPATLKVNWAKELKLWAKTPSIFIAKTKKDKLPKGPGTIIINYDLLGRKDYDEQTDKRKKKTFKTKPNFNFKDFDKVIVDECQCIKNSTATRSKITGKIIKNIKEAILLSGTPMERPIDLYVPLRAMGAIDMSKDEFGHRFCDARLVDIGFRQVWQYRGLSNAAELQKILEPFMLRMLKRDVIDLPKRIIDVVALDLPVDKREKKYSFEDIMKDPRPISFEGLAELLHEQGLKKIPLAFEHIKMRFNEHDKIVVIARHTEVIEELARRLKKFNPVILDGKTKDPQAIVDKFQEDDTCKLLIGQIVSAGVGHTLTRARHIIIVEPDWSYTKIIQVIDRLHRIGQEFDVTAELLTIHKSICERVLYTTLEKEEYIDQLIGL